MAEKKGNSYDNDGGTLAPKAKSEPTDLSGINLKSGLLKTFIAIGIFALTIRISGTRFFETETRNEATYALCSHDTDGNKIYTVDSKNSRVQCIVINEGRVIDSGSFVDIQTRLHGEARAPLQVKYIPTDSVVVPGISDSHCHIIEYGASQQIPLSSGKSVKETVSFVEQYILSNPDIEQNKSILIEGWGWDHASWDVAKMPNWRDLEDNVVVRGRPVILQSRDGHAIWVSEAVLKANSPYPKKVDGGVIVRDEKGSPTGVFMDSARILIDRPPDSEEDLEKGFSTTVRHALSVGLTSLHDAGIDPQSLDFFKRKSEKDKLPLRIYSMRRFDEQAHNWTDTISPSVERNRFTSRSVKMFADGALRTGGAALYEPYSDNPSSRGAMRISAEVFNKVIPTLMQDGWQVNVHAIGDRANAIVLDAFEIALKHTSASALRPRLEHAQIMTSADIERLGALGVIASIQPKHVTSDMWFGEDRLGPERVKGLYAYRNIVNSGAKITFGSDFPVEGINPLAGFYAAITRVSPEGESPHGPSGWFPEQRLTREEALRGMTIDPAYASFTEDTLGSLEPGKIADYVVLSRDIMTVPVEEILETNVLATVLDGEVVYGAL